MRQILQISRLDKKKPQDFRIYFNRDHLASSHRCYHRCFLQQALSRSMLLFDQLRSEIRES